MAFPRRSEQLHYTNPIMGCRYSNCTEDASLGDTHKVFELEASAFSSEKSTKPSFDFMPRPKTPFQALRATAKSWLRSRPNYSELMTALALWEERVYSQLEASVVLAEDLHSSVEVDAGSLTLAHEVDAVRVGPLVADFCSAVQGTYVLTKVPSFDPAQAQSIEDFLVSLRPLTYSFYLTLGSSVDCGVGVNKPMDQRELARFLKSAGDHEGLARWIYEVQPVPTQFSFSYLTSSRSCGFYIFGGDMHDNYRKAMALFDCNGAPLSAEAAELLRTAKSEEASACVTLDEQGVVSLGMQVRGLNAEIAAELGRLLDPRFDPAQWRRLEAESLLTAVELRKDGWVLRQTASVPY